MTQVNLRKASGDISYHLLNNCLSMLSTQHPFSTHPKQLQLQPGLYVSALLDLAKSATSITPSKSHKCTQKHFIDNPAVEEELFFHICLYSRYNHIIVDYVCGKKNKKKEHLSWQPLLSFHQAGPQTPLLILSQKSVFLDEVQILCSINVFSSCSKTNFFMSDTQTTEWSG